MTYDELERFKIEADRWVACVTTDGACSMSASRGLRDIIQRVHDQASQSEADQREAARYRCLRDLGFNIPEEFALIAQVEEWLDDAIRSGATNQKGS